MTVNEMHFGFMLQKETIDAEFMMRRLQEEAWVSGTDRLNRNLDLHPA